jgi:hypothetical protein
MKWGNSPFVTVRFIIIFDFHLIPTPVPPSSVRKYCSPWNISRVIFCIVPYSKVVLWHGNPALVGTPLDNCCFIDTIKLHPLYQIIIYLFAVCFIPDVSSQEHRCSPYYVFHTRLKPLNGNAVCSSTPLPSFCIVKCILPKAEPALSER